MALASPTDQHLFAGIIYNEIQRLRASGNSEGFIQRRLTALGVAHYGVDKQRQLAWKNQMQRYLNPPKAKKKAPSLPGQGQLFDTPRPYSYNAQAANGPNAMFQ